jgi:excisionase family DNA binding protein
MSTCQTHRLTRRETDDIVDRLLTVTQAAEYVAHRPATIRRWILTRRIAYAKIGRSVRVPLSELQRLMTVIPAREEAR